MSAEYNCPPACPKCRRCHRGPCQPDSQANCLHRLVRLSNFNAMKIEIAKEDIWWLRHTLDHAIQYMESQPNPAAFARCPAVARKTIRKLNKAAKKAFGHDLHAETLMSEAYINEGPR